MILHRNKFHTKSNFLINNFLGQQSLSTFSLSICLSKFLLIPTLSSAKPSSPRIYHLHPKHRHIIHRIQLMIIQLAIYELIMHKECALNRCVAYFIRLELEYLVNWGVLSRFLSRLVIRLGRQFKLIQVGSNKVPSQVRHILVINHVTRDVQWAQVCEKNLCKWLKGGNLVVWQR